MSQRSLWQLSSPQSYFILTQMLGQKLTKHKWKDLIKSAVSDSFEYDT